MTESATPAYVKVLCLFTGPIWQPAALDSCLEMDDSLTAPSRFWKATIDCRRGVTSNSVRTCRASEILATTGIAARRLSVPYAQTSATSSEASASRGRCLRGPIRRLEGNFACHRRLSTREHSEPFVRRRDEYHDYREEEKRRDRRIDTVGEDQAPG